MTALPAWITTTVRSFTAATVRMSSTSWGSRRSDERSPPRLNVRGRSAMRPGFSVWGSTDN
jgi:hypothetical protein